MNRTVTSGNSTALVETFDSPAPSTGYVKLTVVEGRRPATIRLGRLDAARLAYALLEAGGATGPFDDDEVPEDEEVGS